MERMNLFRDSEQEKDTTTIGSMSNNSIRKFIGWDKEYKALLQCEDDLDKYGIEEDYVDGSVDAEPFYINNCLRCGNTILMRDSNIVDCDNKKIYENSIVKFLINDKFYTGVVLDYYGTLFIVCDNNDKYLLCNFIDSENNGVATSKGIRVIGNKIVRDNDSINHIKKDCEDLLANISRYLRDYNEEIDSEYCDKNHCSTLLSLALIILKKINKQIVSRYNTYIELGIIENTSYDKYEQKSDAFFDCIDSEKELNHKLNLIQILVREFTSFVEQDL